MKKKYRIITGVVAALWLLAGTTQASAKKWECGERSNLPLEGKNYCAAGDFRQSEINLLKVFDPLVERYKHIYGNATDLQQAQDAYEMYRSSQCIAENQRIADEPYYPMLVAQCKTKLTNLRIGELQRMLAKLP